MQTTPCPPPVHTTPKLNETYISSNFPEVCRNLAVALACGKVVSHANATVGIVTPIDGRHGHGYTHAYTDFGSHYPLGYRHFSTVYPCATEALAAIVGRMIVTLRMTDPLRIIG